MVVQHWVLLTGGWSRSDHSLVRSAKTIRSHVHCLALTLNHPAALRRTLAVIANLLEHGTGITKRRKKPSLPQLLAIASSQP